MFFHSSEYCFLLNFNLWSSLTQLLTSGHYFFYCFPPPVVRRTVLLSKTLDRWTGLYNPRWVPVETNWMLSFSCKRNLPAVKYPQLPTIPVYKSICLFFVAHSIAKVAFISDYGCWGFGVPAKWKYSVWVF